jgi:hypothetical protein
VSDEPTDAVPVGRPQPRRTSSLERLRRRTTSGRYIPEIDGLRFICIMLVVLLHIQEMTQVWLGSGRRRGAVRVLEVDPRSAQRTGRLGCRAR